MLSYQHSHLHDSLVYRDSFFRKIDTCNKLAYITRIMAFLVQKYVHVIVIIVYCRWLLVLDWFCYLVSQFSQFVSYFRIWWRKIFYRRHNFYTFLFMIPQTLLTIALFITNFTRIFTLCRQYITYLSREECFVIYLRNICQNKNYLILHQYRVGNRRYWALSIKYWQLKPGFNHLKNDGIFSLLDCGSRM